MSDEYDDLDNDEQDESTGGGNAAKVLRKQNSELKKQLAAIELQHQELQTRVRHTTVADALDQHGAAKRLAKYVPDGVADSEGVLEWLRENGEDFGWQPAEEPDEAEAHNREQARRISSVDAQAPAARLGGLTPELIAGATTRAELNAIYAQYA